MTITGVTTYLWFDREALEAAEFYVSIFPDSRILGTSYYQKDAQKRAGEVLTVDFELFGRPFAGLNAGPDHPHSPAVSFQVYCDTQDEVDALWGSLTSNGGEPGRCGWCRDRFGISWQVVPNELGELLRDPDSEVSGYAFGQMMTMGKIVIADLRR